MAARHLLGDPGPGAIDPARASLVDDVGLDRLAPGRQLGEGRGLHVAEDRHRDGPRDRRGGHDEQVRRRAALLPQRISLLDAEPVLLVHDDQREVEKRHVLLDERVGADDDPSVTSHRVVERGSTGRRRLASREQGDLGAQLRPAEHPAHRQIAEQGRDRAMVLGREDLRRSQQSGLAARVDDREHGSQRDDGLARSDLALQQAVHRPIGSELGGDEVADLALACRQGERQPGVEGREQAVGTRHTGARVQRLRGSTALSEDRLQDERLVIAKAPHPGADVILQPRSVDELQGVAAAEQPATQPDCGWQRLADLLDAVQDQGHRGAQHERGDLARRGVDRHLMGAQVVGPLGGQPLLQQLHLGMGELAAPSISGHRPREHPPQTGPQSEVVLVLAEEGEVKFVPAVGDDRGAAEPAALAHRHDRDRRDLGDDHDVLALAQLPQVGQLVGRQIGARDELQQVTDRLQPLVLGQCLGLRRLDDAPQRGVLGVCREHRLTRRPAAADRAAACRG